MSENTELKTEVKKVEINEEKNQVIGPPTGQSEKIDLSSKYKFLVLDTLTDSVVGLFKSNRKAQDVIIKLVKIDLKNIIEINRMKILQGESIEENRIYLQIIKQSLYQISTITQSNNTMINLGDKNLCRYKVVMIPESEEDVDEADLIPI